MRLGKRLLVFFVILIGIVFVYGLIDYLTSGYISSGIMRYITVAISIIIAVAGMSCYDKKSNK